ncbi:MAG: S46 family peptidase [Bacteroidales bacterium]
MTFLKSICFALIILITTSKGVLADEGLWIPSLLSKYTLKDMKKAGFKLTEEDIYSINKACLSNAVVGLSSEGMGLTNFCSGSFISDKGLVITNYHCVMRYIEQYSNPGQDLLANGYWADSLSGEIRAFDLYVHQLMQVIDVTELLLKGTQNLSTSEKEQYINKRSKIITDSLTNGKSLDGLVSSYFGGNQYLLSLYKVFKDVRIVGVPPISVGKFGGDTDNWQWPRHTGDFAFLRVYANKSNKPAAYNKHNLPYTPEKFLTINANGVKEGDFAMVMGYPSSTRRYIPSFALEKIIKDDNNFRIAIREIKINAMKDGITRDPNLKFRYTTRISSLTNQMLKYKGELNGENIFGIVAKRIDEEKEFESWINQEDARKAKYGNLLDSMRKHYAIVSLYNKADLLFNESAINGAEIVPIAGKFEKLVSIVTSKRKSAAKAALGEAKHLKTLIHQIYNNYNAEVDSKIFGEMLKIYYNNLPKNFQSDYMKKIGTKYNGDFEKFTEEAFATTFLTDSNKVVEFLDSVPSKGIELLTSDPIYQMAIGFYRTYVDKINMQRNKLQAEQRENYALYQEGIAEMHGKENLYPDANKTLRLSYGKVFGLVPNDGETFEYTTTADGILEKRMKNTENVDYKLPVRLKNLIETKDYGRYGNDGELNVNFITNCHTSSGNSGSPVIDAKGQLIGVNFDRIWQGVYSDYMYNDEYCRNISVDVRYILFFVEKFAKADRIVNELTIK